MESASGESGRLSKAPDSDSMDPAMMEELLKLVGDLNAHNPDGNESSSSAETIAKATTDPRSSLVCNDPVVVEALRQSTIDMNTEVAQAAAVVATATPTFSSLCDVFLRLLRVVCVPTKLATALAPLPLPPLPAIRPELMDINAELINKSRFASTITETLPCAPVPTCYDSVPQHVDHPSRSEDAYLYASGWRGSAGGYSPSEGIDRTGCRFVSGMHRWSESVMSALSLLKELMECMADAGQGHAFTGWMVACRCPGADDGASVATDMPIGMFVVICVSPYASYAPWSNADLYRAAMELLNMASASELLPDSVWTSRILPWTREVTREERWKHADRISLRYALSWIVSHFPITAFNSDSVGHLLPTVFRFADDWETTNAWMGISCLLSLCCRGIPEHFRPYQGLLTEALRRVGTSKNSAVIAVWSVTNAAVFATVRSLTSSDGNDALVVHPKLSAIDHIPQVQFVQRVLKNLVLCPTQAVMKASLLGLQPALLQLNNYSKLILRDCMQHLVTFGTKTADGGLCMLCFHLVHLLIQLCGDRFALTETDLALLDKYGDKLTPWTIADLGRQGHADAVNLADVAAKCHLLDLVVQLSVCSSEFEVAGLHLEGSSRDAVIDETACKILDRVCTQAATATYIKNAVATVLARASEELP